MFSVLFLQLNYKNVTKLTITFHININIAA